MRFSVDIELGTVYCEDDDDGDGVANFLFNDCTDEKMVVVTFLEVDARSDCGAGAPPALS